MTVVEFLDRVIPLEDIEVSSELAKRYKRPGIRVLTDTWVESMELDYVMMPRATDCQPQVASFGWTEAQAREQGLDVRVTKFPFTANGTAHGLGDTAGFVKLISDARCGELLGANLIGPTPRFQQRCVTGPTAPRRPTRPAARTVDRWRRSWR